MRGRFRAFDRCWHSSAWLTGSLCSSVVSMAGLVAFGCVVEGGLGRQGAAGVVVDAEVGGRDWVAARE